MDAPPTDCDECQTTSCWLRAVVCNPSLLPAFVRWLRRHDLVEQAEQIERTPVPQSIAYCETWWHQQAG